MISSITVCVNYSDYLETSLKHNSEHFDEIIIVSDTKDNKTHQLCVDRNIKCIKTDIFYEDNKPFFKSGGINLGIGLL